MCIRDSVCRDRHPIDRLARVLERLAKRASEEEIMEYLRAEDLRLRITQDRGIRYVALEGKFKRLSEAWSFVSPKMRRDFLADE